MPNVDHVDHDCQVVLVHHLEEEFEVLVEFQLRSHPLAGVVCAHVVAQGGSKAITLQKVCVCVCVCVCV